MHQEKIYQAFHLDEAPFENLLTQADDAIQAWRALYPLSEDEELGQRSYDEAFLVRYTYNSAAIEGSTLSLVDLVCEQIIEEARARYDGIMQSRG